MMIIIYQWGGAMRKYLLASFFLLYLGEASEIWEVARKLPGSCQEVPRKSPGSSIVTGLVERNVSFPTLLLDTRIVLRSIIRQHRSEQHDGR